MVSSTRDEQPCLDERISLLSALCAAPPDGADIPGLIGLLGAAYLELYERDRSAEVLDAALRRFHDAFVIASEHPDQTQWCYGLGIGYAHRAARSGQVADYDLAIDWLSRLHAGLSDADPDRDYAAVLLMDAYWDRFYAVRYGDTCDTTTALREARKVTAAIGSLAVPGDPELAAYARLLLGLAHLALFDERGDRADLYAGIDRLATALAALPPDSPRYAFAGAWLVDAYQRRAELDDDPFSLDLCIATGERILSSYGPDDHDWTTLNGFQALGYEARWRRTEDLADLDQAVTHWRASLKVDLDPWAAAHCGELLHQRAEVLSDAADLPEAIRLLDLAAQSGATGDPDWWLRWLELAEAHHAHWRLGRAPESLIAASRCLDRSLELALPGSDARLLVHNQRVLVACEMLRHEGSHPHSESPPATARLRRCLSDANRDLDNADTALQDMRAMLGTLLGYGEMYVAAYEMKDIDIERIRDLIARGAQLSNQPPGWRKLTETGTGLVRYAMATQRPAPGMDGGVGELVRTAAGQQLDEITDVARRVLPIALQARAMWTGDLRSVGAAGSMLRQIGAGKMDLAYPDPADGEFEVLADLFSAVDRGQRGDFTMALEVTERALAALDHLQASLPTERTFRPMLSFVRAAASAAIGQPVSVDELPEPVPGEVLMDHELWQLILAAAAQVSVAVAGNDIAALRRHTAKLAALAGRARSGLATRMMAAVLAGLSELEVARRDPSDRAAAARSATWYEELANASGPDHPLWTQIALNFAEALRRAGHRDRARTRRLGMSALQAHGWRVLLQSGTDHAIESAQATSADAHKVAGWCLADQAYDDMVAALDAGRGLVLRSATASREVADLLTGMGHDELAAEWRASAGFGRNQLTGGPLTRVAESVEVPDDLRLRVLRALGIDEGAGSALPLLTPISVGEVRRALAIVGSDAPVLLVPASSACPGTAVVVPASGPVDAIALPGPWTGAGSPIDEHVKGFSARRDIQMPTPPGASGVSQRLDELCRWAWSAAMEALLGYVRRWHLSHPARLVLVPMGSLALVPWHAAYVDTVQGRRYAVQEVVFSYSVSARMFCATAARPIQQTRSALIVGDPRGVLPFAGIEAQAIHGRFYPNGRYLGHPRAGADGSGTPDEVLDWIASASGPSMLHFACHGNVDANRPADAHLVLAGGMRAARRLLEVSRLSALVLERVFLAACTTNLTGTDYDEAFSLATAFLAAGAHTVFGSLWSVPDEDTSVLMYLVHHNLNVESCTPVDALHRAQLWMLDPQRRPPDPIPPVLQRSFSRPQSAHPMSWAAFTHLGR